MVGVPIRISAVPVATLASFMEACEVRPSSDLAALGSYAGFSQSTAKKAIPTLESLGIVKRDSAGCYAVAVDAVARGTTDEQKAAVLRKALLGYRPFEALIEGLAHGEHERDVIRKTLQLLDLSEADTDKLRLLLRMGVDLGVLERNGDCLALVADYEPDSGAAFIPLVAGDIESEAKARLFNARHLGSAANNYLDEVDRGLLVEALTKHGVDPRHSIESAGQALEDFLRHIASDNGLAAEGKKASGAGQLANVLYSKGLIHNHHQKLVDAVATVRNATAHRKDKKTLAPWTLTPFGAFSALASTLTAIRSIYAYTAEGQQSI